VKHQKPGICYILNTDVPHLILQYHHHTTTVLQPFFWDHPGEPVPEENFWTLWCKGRLTQEDTDHPVGCHSIQTQQCPPPLSPNPSVGWLVGVECPFSAKIQLYQRRSQFFSTHTRNDSDGKEMIEQKSNVLVCD